MAKFGKVSGLSQLDSDDGRKQWLGQVLQKQLYSSTVHNKPLILAPLTHDADCSITASWGIINSTTDLILLYLDIYIDI